MSPGATPRSYHYCGRLSWTKLILLRISIQQYRRTQSLFLVKHIFSVELEKLSFHIKTSIHRRIVIRPWNIYQVAGWMVFEIVCGHRAEKRSLSEISSIGAGATGASDNHVTLDTRFQTINKKDSWHVHCQYCQYCIPGTMSGGIRNEIQETTTNNPEGR